MYIMASAYVCKQSVCGAVAIVAGAYLWHEHADGPGGGGALEAEVDAITETQPLSGGRVEHLPERGSATTQGDRRTLQSTRTTTVCVVGSVN
jgi:hypothetical protein